MATKENKGTILDLMKKAKTPAARANEYYPRIKKSIYFDRIVNLEEKIAEKKSKVYDLENMSLITNVNKGMSGLSKDQVQERLEQIMDLEEEITLLELKLKSRKVTFEKYLGDLPSV